MSSSWRRRAAFESRAELEVHWLHRTCRDGGRPSRLLDALAIAWLSEGECHAWVACESADARASLLNRGVGRAALKASGYWRCGVAATHEVHDRDGP